MGTREPQRLATLGLAVVAAVGCEHATAPPSLTVPPKPPAAMPAAPATPATPSGQCLADDLPTLVPGWEMPPECRVDADSSACIASCADGTAEACFARAIAVERAPHGEREARALFERACRRGLATGCTNWGAYEWTAEHTADVQCVARVFAKACDATDGFGCFMVGRILIEADKTPEAVARARTVLERACDELEGPPCRALAFYIEKGTFGPPDPGKIKDLMKRACDGGDQDACGQHATVRETFH